jgi:hypothetical protein
VKIIAALLPGLLLVLFIGLLAKRRYLLRGSGGISMSVRAGSGRGHPRDGWTPGVGRFISEELLWYRLLGLGLRPEHVLRRDRLVLAGRRAPRGREIQVLPLDTVILECRHNGTEVELAVMAAAAAGFSSWLESAAPNINRGEPGRSGA